MVSQVHVTGGAASIALFYLQFTDALDPLSYDIPLTIKERTVVNLPEIRLADQANATR
jgi:hypothetical protein